MSEQLLPLQHKQEGLIASIMTYTQRLLSMLELLDDAGLDVDLAQLLGDLGILALVVAQVAAL